MINRLYCRRDDCEIDRLHPEHEEDFTPDREALGDGPPPKKHRRKRSIEVMTAAELIARVKPQLEALAQRRGAAYAIDYWRDGGKLPLGVAPRSCMFGHRLLPGSDVCVAGHTRRHRQRQI